MNMQVAQIERTPPVAQAPRPMAEAAAPILVKTDIPDKLHKGSGKLSPKEVLKTLIPLVLRDLEDKNSNVLNKLFEHAVNGKKSNEEIIVELGCTPEEAELVSNLDFGLDGNLNITNKVTGEVYFKSSDIKSAMFANLGKINFAKTLSMIGQQIKDAFMKKDGKVSVEGMTEALIKTNVEFFEAVVEDNWSQIQNKGLFTSLAEKALAALNRGGTKVLQEIPS